MKKLSVVCAVALFTSLVGPAKAVPTAEQLIPLLDDQSISNYVTGIAAGIQVANTWNDLSGDPVLYCASEDVPMSADLSKAILKLGATKSSDNDTPAPIAMLIGLQEMFPCR